MPVRFIARQSIDASVAEEAMAMNSTANASSDGPMVCAPSERMTSASRSGAALKPASSRWS